VGLREVEVAMLDHERIVRQAYQLQPLPQSCMRLAALTTQELPDLREITEVISYDPVLAAKLLRMANSALYYHRQIGTVNEAVRHLGARTVFGLAVAACAEPVLTRAVPGYALSPGELWRHSTATALAAQLAEGFCQVPWPPLAFTAALLHDLGKLVLGEFLTPEYQALCERAVVEGKLAPYQAETEILSLHHGEVSGVIAQHWNLPQDIVNGVTHHHAPAEEHGTISFITHLANAVARQVTGNPVSTEAELRALQVTRDRLGLTREGFDRLAEATAARFNGVCDRFI
jgi:HD-like signal output (HDOD) protein